MEKMENQHSSAVAFVAGGTQDACEDSCSICLEPFCNSDPSSVTGCNHDFHLQCILECLQEQEYSVVADEKVIGSLLDKDEKLRSLMNVVSSLNKDLIAVSRSLLVLRCQRSSQCPMCWQAIYLKDLTSQTLLEVVEKERIIRGNRSHGSVYLRPVLTGLEFGQLEPRAESAELDEHLMQQLAAAAITDRALEIAEREILSNSNRSMNNTSSLITNTGSRVMAEEVRQQVSPPQINPLNQAPVQTSSSLSIGASGNHPGGSINRNLSGKTTPSSNGIEGPSEFQGFSESLKSRLNAASSRYRESIRKNTRGWKERLFSRNIALSDLGSEVKKEVSNGIASVSRMMQRLEAKDNSYVNEVNKNKNNADSSSNTNPNPSMRSHLARVAASDGSSLSPFLNNASSSNPCIASPSSK